MTLDWFLTSLWLTSSFSLTTRLIQDCWRWGSSSKALWTQWHTALQNVSILITISHSYLVSPQATYYTIDPQTQGASRAPLILAFAWYSSQIFCLHCFHKSSPPVTTQGKPCLLPKVCLLQPPKSPATVCSKYLTISTTTWGFPGGVVVKNLSANAGDAGWISAWWRSRVGNGNPLQYFCLENSRAGYSAGGLKELDLTKPTPTHIHSHTHHYLDIFGKWVSESQCHQKTSSASKRQSRD